MYDFDVIVIGAGPAGYPAAIRAAQLGKKTAIIEKEAFGGTCLNWGCIPTKTLIASAERYHHAAHSEAFGVTAKGVAFDYAQMAARKAGIVAKLSGGVKMLLQSNGVELIAGAARFEGPNRLSVVQPDGAVRWLSAAAIIVAAGSDAAMPGFLPKDRLVMDSRAFLDLTALPKNLLILGGGVIGCEFACMAATLGASVTIVEMLEDIVMVLDRDVRRVLRKRMEALGITLLTGAPLTNIAVKNGTVSGTYKEQTVTGDVLLVAVGRKPNTAALDLARAGVKVDERGTIPVDAQGRTNIASVFAVGDLVTGSIQLAHAATQQGVVAAEAAAGLRSKVEKVCPSCIFTSPEIGLAGLTEAKAQQLGIAVKTAVFPFSALGKAMAAGETDGFVKWLADPVTGQVLGAQAIGGHATELIAEAATAIRNELTIDELGNTIHSHPTLSEAWMEAAHAFHNACIHLPKRG
ncbi:MAG: dihydrolipoyl dehydrogenase [Verrucomicrobiota bacterium]|jgi:dihydrolipoamide dehydrogenase|nr:dihydrolipoyl dehydrogenase [Verrucomicrobiota bacterium]